MARVEIEDELHKAVAMAAAKRTVDAGGKPRVTIVQYVDEALREKLAREAK